MDDRTFLQKAEQRRRVAYHADDPAVAILLAMAEEFDARAAAQPAVVRVRAGMSDADLLLTQALEYRDIAKRARRLADSMVDETEWRRLYGHAEDLEAQATELDCRAVALQRNPVPVVTHQQKQVQQQSENPEPEKPKG